MPNMRTRDKRATIEHLNTRIEHDRMWIERLTVVRKELAVSIGIEPLLNAITRGEGDPSWMSNIQPVGNYNTPGYSDSRYALDAAKGHRLLEGWDGRGIRTLQADMDENVERRDAIQATLPTTEQLSNARDEIADHEEDLARIDTLCEDRWDTITELLIECVTFARELANGRDQQKQMVSAIERLKERFDLPGRHTTWKPSGADSNDLKQLTSVIADLAIYGETDLVKGWISRNGDKSRAA